MRQARSAVGLAVSVGVALSGVGYATLVQAADVKRHAVSLVAPPKMAPDFKAFDWVRPDAPKGGTLRQSVIGSFDTLNPFPTAKGLPATGIGLVHDTLFAATPDEASTAYGLIAEWLSYPDDYSSVTFGLRPEARFHDGKPITPEDVIFSLEEQMRVNQNRKYYYQHVIKAEKTGPHEVTFRFDVKNNREMPQIVSDLMVVPKHWWQGKTEAGVERDIGSSTMEPLMGSGPYKIKSVQPGRSVTYERNADWWARDLPVAKGQYNFDTVQYEYFLDRVPAFEAFKTGQLDIWRENSAKAWATEYVFDAVQRKAVIAETFPVRRVAAMQAFVPNLRRPQFQDARVRRALNLAFDFEWSNKNLFYGQYKRINSYFDNSELASRDLPTGRELELLSEVKADVPPEVFSTPWSNPVTDGSGEDRTVLREASKLFQAAGLTRKDGALSLPTGEPLAFEILLDEPSLNRIVQPYLRVLEKLGVKASVRLVDSAQYKRRLDTFDFDMVLGQFPQSESPGNEQRFFFGSASADQSGSRNIAGIKNKAVDALIEKIVFATDRADLVAATRALDRVLLWNHYVIPHWHLPADRYGFWNKFGRPEKLPSRSVDILRTWWVDTAKATALQK